MEVKCDYCGSWMDDKEQFCPNCGAANSNLTRTTNKTPKTIEELKDWYRARNLPPYETTRFFIGIDYKLPKAFGIYKDGDEFVVYKNKADGTRAVRYRGKDEAYAVNELYLRLKEEILNQKNINSGSRSNTGRSSSAYSTVTSKAKGGCLTVIAIFFAVIFAMAGVSAIKEKVNEKYPQASCYYRDGSDVYYYYGYDGTNDRYEWWQLDNATGEWYLDGSYSDYKEFTDNLTRDNYVGFLSDVLNELEVSYDDYEQFEAETTYNIYNSHAYKDAHHRVPSESAYYVIDGQSYYYLEDLYGASYGNGNNSGWYVYNDSGWEYYSDGDDHDTLGDDLWYHDDRYFVANDYTAYTSGSVYSFSDSESSQWNSESLAKDFSSTTWYQESVAAESSYNEATKSSSSSDSSSSSWSDDSAWDWDSSSSWDSGGSDWSSDW